MDALNVLWVDLRLNRDAVSSDCCLSKNWTISHICNSDHVVREIREKAPALLCFEYDFPNISNLSVLREARCLFPLMPIFMLTEQHSEALAVWALRMRVSDYFAKPLETEDLIASMTTILTLTQLSVLKDAKAYPSQQTNTLFNPIPVELRFRTYQKKRTYLAKSFMETHYHEKIHLKKVAQLPPVSG